MKRLHYFSGITLSIFIAIHLVNHLMSLMGELAYITFMDQMRLIYRNRLVELVIFSAVLIQIITGVKLFLQKRKTVRGFFAKLQIWSGLYLAIFFLIHVGAVLMGRFVLNLDTNFYFGVAGLNTFPFYLFFAPYYGLAITAFFGHIAAIHSIKMKREILGLSVVLQSKIIVALGIILSITILFGLTNGFSGVAIPEAYDVLIGR